MLTLLSEIKFWSASLTEDELNVKDTDYGTFNCAINASSLYNKRSTAYKRDYSEKRGSALPTYKKQSLKLKTSLKHLEEELQSKKVVYCEWTDVKTFQLMLSNGLLIYVEVNIFTGDVYKISFDKYFVGKIISEYICDVLITRQHILISYNENQITFVHLQKPSMKNMSQKISAADPKIFNIIIGGHTKRMSRNLVVNFSNDLVLIWTKSSQNEFFPWRPSVKDQERANLHIYKLCRLKFEPLCFYWTENDPIGFEFSKFNENEIHSVEQKISRKGEVTIESCTYHFSDSKSKLVRTSVTSIPLQTEVSCNAFSPDHEKLLMGCIDGSIVLFDEGRGTTYLVKASFIPTQVSWHPDSALVMIGNERGQLQCFDISLSCVKNQLLSDDITPSNILDLSSFFVRQPNLLKLCWGKKPDISNHYEKFAQVDCFLLLMFENGIFASMRYVGGTGLKNDIHTSGLTGDVIIQMYLSLQQIEKAINVLLSLNWNNYGAMNLLSLHKIANQIFRLPATEVIEELLQKALGSFHVPTKPLCFETETEFGDNVDDITRRFFHYLIRYKSFEKAFSLAIDINDADLFMILFKCTKVHGLKDLAEESLKKADDIYSKEEIDSHHSTCSVTSCSICSDTSESETEDDISTQSSNLPIEKKQERSVSPVKRMNKSLSADILNHPPLPRFPRYNVKKTNETCSEGYVPPLPHVNPNDDLIVGAQILKSESALKSLSLSSDKKKNASMTNLASSDLTFQNLSKFSSVDEFHSVSTFNPLSFQNQQLSVVDIVPKPKSEVIDQTLGIPLTFDINDNAGNSFNPSMRSQIQSNNDYDNMPQISTMIHQYPLISGTIPSTTQAKVNFKNLPVPTINLNKKKETLGPTGSILSNATNSSANNSNSPGNKKEGGEKNKVKFSDTIEIAVVPEIPRKEKIINFNERLKRKPLMDPRRELAESLPLTNPDDDYLGLFSPNNEKKKESANKTGDGKKPSIKVVHFGVV